MECTSFGTHVETCVVFDLVERLPAGTGVTARESRRVHPHVGAKVDAGVHETCCKGAPRASLLRPRECRHDEVIIDRRNPRRESWERSLDDCAIEGNDVG